MPEVQNLPTEVRVSPNMVWPTSDDSCPEEGTIIGRRVQHYHRGEWHHVFYSEDSDKVRTWLKKNGYNQVKRGMFSMDGTYRREVEHA